MDPSECQNYTERLLRRTLPFDESTAILFVPAKGQTPSPVASDTTNTSWDQKLAGEEAKTFYEEIINTVSDKTDNIIDCGDNKKRECVSCVPRKRKRRASGANLKKKLVPKYSSLDVFRFAQEGDVDRVKEALSAGNFDVNTSDNYDWTLLMIASCAGHVTLVSYLLECGAQWEGREDRRGMDAVDLAQENGHYNIVDLILYNKSRRGETTSTDTGEYCKETLQPFYCDICKFNVTSLSEQAHSVSILHQYNCQHRSKGTSYGISERNRGFKMMIRNGWDPDKGLGSCGQGRHFPVKTVLKRDRCGIGKPTSQARVTHFAPGDVKAVKNGYYCQTKKSGKKQREEKMAREKRQELRLRRYFNE